jgi:hypothetical protein
MQGMHINKLHKPHFKLFWSGNTASHYTYTYWLTIIFKDTFILKSDIKTDILAYKRFLIIAVWMCYHKGTQIENRITINMEPLRLCHQVKIR